MQFEPGKGPIPGENYTSDTKNYPWHQAPEYVDINKALDYLSKIITKKSTANGLMTLIEMGTPLYKVSIMLLMMGIMQGKWTVDFALLLSGPLTRMIEILCVGYGVEYDIGIEEEDDMPTGSFYKTLYSGDSVTAVPSSDPSTSIPSDATQGTEPNLGSGGFMQQVTSGAGK